MEKNTLVSKRGKESVRGEREPERARGKEREVVLCFIDNSKYRVLNATNKNQANNFSFENTSTLAFRCSSWDKDFFSHEITEMLDEIYRLLCKIQKYFLFCKKREKVQCSSLIVLSISDVAINFQYGREIIDVPREYC